MGKGKGRGKGGREDRASDVAAPINNPFGALAGLRDALPPADAPSSEPQSAATEPSSEADHAVHRWGKIVVGREKKGRAGKTVTRIEGLPAAELEDVAKRLKTALGCGAMVEGEALLLQGALVERARAWLEAAGARRVVISGS
jgi:translation initiation factor 1